jgi:hypothetical protein
VAVAHRTDFFITASTDGHIKFWKKQQQGVEFAKHYKVLCLVVWGRVFDCLAGYRMLFGGVQ